MKGLKKVNGEMNLIMLVYNIKRTITLLGLEKMLAAINNWIPDYKKVFCFLQKAIYSHFLKIIKEVKIFDRYSAMNIEVA